MAQRHSSPVRVVRRGCRHCRNPIPKVFGPCPCCGTVLPRIRFVALPLWAAFWGTAFLVLKHFL